uniref:NADH-ubiquinone oxidoreductase chain 1 n=2 Tax=Autobranchia TaxID=2785011 RepID=A0A455ZBW6_9BIVA|nr:NADH dehydrogenase subunit 1 [Margaritifera margaritifera]QCX42012.1 NADH dehydrogenase subunit 1 [Margaritifera margaritifera]QCX42025.1 NADH dehydrogenase subunit 1 [Margaritifera margaritifera]QCX42038.1 NADH dehydrogenase subunit 1 [Margaritifera margaritifera]QRW36430.1 NADH dehydrogenase subunit 1 [Margaritifera margaritifera]DAC74120.1 TPA_inf: NADH dehydrogenase subunit 1 [Margaritifera margaritifera]
MISHTISTLTTYLLILLAVAFFTLLERKMLGYFQIRKGPNKVGIMGLPQPLADALKLFVKEWVMPVSSNLLPFILTPSLMLILALSLWQLFPSFNLSFQMALGMFLFLCISSLSVYTTLMAGWASNSKYALLGAIRAMAQTISYEVTMTLIIIFYLMLKSQMDMVSIRQTNLILPTALLLIPLAIMWVTVILAETNRAPFDFAEGESELVSGFNIEYGGAGFAFLFMAEYSNILMMSLFSASMLTGHLIISAPIAMMFLWARATLPRYRYDLLMNMAWKSFLSVSLMALSALTPLLLLVL